QGTLNYNGPDTLTVTSRDSNAVTDVDKVGRAASREKESAVNAAAGAQGENEDTGLALGGLSVTAVDGNLIMVQLAVANGTRTVARAGAATISAGSNGTATIPLTGSQADISSALASSAHQGTLNYNGPDTLTVTSRDSNAVTDVD